ARHDRLGRFVPPSCPRLAATRARIRAGPCRPRRDLPPSASTPAAAGAGTLALTACPGAGRSRRRSARLAAGYAVRARGAGIRRAYRAAFRGFAAWCATLDRGPVPADPELV